MIRERCASFYSAHPTHHIWTPFRNTYLDNNLLTGFNREMCFQIQFPDQAIHGRLAMFVLDFGKDQHGAVAGVAAAQAGLYVQQLAGAIDGHYGEYCLR